MPKSIIIRRALAGSWCGYTTPTPKMPTKDSVYQWKDFESMVKSLKRLGVKVVVYNDELVALLSKHGVSASKPVKKPY